MLPHNPVSYDDLVDRFAWKIPQTFNIGVACSDRVAESSPDKIAVVDFSGDEPSTLSFSGLSKRSNQFANALVDLGVNRGDRVAIMQPQSHACVIAHLGIYKVGAIAVPLATQFGPEAMLHRLRSSGAIAIVTNASGVERLNMIKQDLPDLRIQICTQGAIESAVDFDRLLEKSKSDFKAVETSPNDPAMMLFTSGTTGQPKGALHGHRVLLGHLPGIQMAQGFMPQQGDLFWTPSDWAWAGGLLNALLPALYFGVPVVAARAQKFSAEWAISLIKRAGIRNIFMPPTALKLMQSSLNKKHDLNLRTIGCAGEALGRETLRWARDTLGIQINEFYGQTECNAIISACHEIGVWREGSMGRPVPGHEVTVLTDDGLPAPVGTAGEIAIHRSSPVMFLGYHKDEAATAGKFKGEWMVTGDRATCDQDGYFHFIGRNDDVITSAGYRIGPTEIEDCLTSHKAVALAAVVGHADSTRTQKICAFIKLADGFESSQALKKEIRNYVKSRLSAHEYPREITFVDDIPLTESGKVVRRHFRK